MFSIFVTNSGKTQKSFSQTTENFDKREAVKIENIG